MSGLLSINRRYAMRARDKWAAKMQTGTQRMLSSLQTSVEEVRALFDSYAEFTRVGDLPKAEDVRRNALEILQTLKNNAYLQGVDPEHRKMRSHVFRLEYFFNPLDVTPLKRAIAEIEAILSEHPDEETRRWAEANMAQLARLKRKPHTT